MDPGCLTPFPPTLHRAASPRTLTFSLLSRSRAGAGGVRRAGKARVWNREAALLSLTEDNGFQELAFGDSHRLLSASSQKLSVVVFFKLPPPSHIVLIIPG